MHGRGSLGRDFNFGPCRLEICNWMRRRGALIKDISMQDIHVYVHVNFGGRAQCLSFKGEGDIFNLNVIFKTNVS